ncbi:MULTISPECIES: Hsp20/alpha crystallin family protein [unclassified Actinotalea]|uniref:Hsp20/alpha crystallin family protein n=1 Tax=unclassified Actinotalea TaxID=2638618 RepID=UPI0015F69C61|nr:MULTISPECIES: Hsp20/alpha crystallin family protein [unclassified Actinotalea]
MAARLEPIDPTRWMDQLLGSVREAAQAPQTAAMPLDLYRAGDHYVLQVDLPGVDPGSVDVNVEDRTLTIRAERTAPTDADVQWLARERASGTYVRQLTVGRGLALDRVQAAYADGVLTLTIPVAEESRSRRIEVQHGSPATTIGGGRGAEASGGSAGS